MWETLGIEATHDESAIRRAYAARMRVWRPDSHPLEFSRLREAYEAALRWARAAVEQPRDDAGADVAPASRAPAARPAPEQPAAPPQAPNPYEAAEALVQQLGRDYSEHGEAQGVQTLRAQYEQVTQGSIDAKLEWETVLLHSFVTARTPPMALVFEADRLLRWMGRLPDISRMFGDPAAQRLRLLLEMAYECMYARHFSPNGWHARLFRARPVSWFGATALVLDASLTAEYWRRLCQSGDLDDMVQVLDGKALRRMSGLMVLSCDVLFAALVAFAGWSLVRDSFNPPPAWVLAAWTAAAFALLIPLPMAGRWVWRSAAAKRFVGWWGWLKGLPGIVSVFALIVVFVGAVIAAAPENPLAMRVPAIALLVTASAAFYAFLMTVVWIMVRWVERLVCVPWVWLLRTWGNLRFEHALRRADSPPTVAQQLRNLAPAAARSWKAFWAARRVTAQRRREQAQQGKSTFGAGGGVNWWWIFVAISLINVLARLANLAK